jgi:hypothetical protein
VFYPKRETASSLSWKVRHEAVGMHDFEVINDILCIITSDVVDELQGVFEKKLQTTIVVEHDKSDIVKYFIYIFVLISAPSIRNTFIYHVLSNSLNMF